MYGSTFYMSKETHLYFHVEINYVYVDFIGDSIDSIANKVQAKVVYFYYKTIIDVLSNVY